MPVGTFAYCDGAAWQPLSAGLNHWVYALAAAGQNVYVGGAFTDAGGSPDGDYIARWVSLAYRLFLPVVLKHSS